MWVAILSDIHSNLEALSTALEYIHKSGRIDDTICLGDVVGYGADPGECIKICREEASVILMGNHDQAVFEEKYPADFNLRAAEAVLWTREKLSGSDRSYLSSLPFVWTRENLRFVHATPDQPEQWGYILSEYDAQMKFSAFSEEICFIGHSHVPSIYSERKPPVVRNGKYFFTHGEKYIINVGSVGQPRDLNPQLAFGIFDTDEWSFRLVRLDYDIKTASRKILEAGLPSILAVRLSRGM